MFFYGTGLHPVWWLTWLAPLPLLLIASRVSRRFAFTATAAAWFIGSLNMWSYLLKVIAIPFWVVLTISLAPALLFGVAVLLFRRFVRRSAPWRAALVFPAFWVSLEYLNNTTSPHGTFASLGYTQMNFLTVLQVASLTGIWGITFCVFLFPASIAALASKHASIIQKKRLAMGALLFFVIVAAFGSWRLRATPETAPAVKVGLMATGAGTTFPHKDDTALELFRDYAGKLNVLSTQGAQLIILPEKIAVISDQATGQLDSLYSTAAAASKSSVLVGLDRGTATRRFNEARLYASRGALLATYDKHHMVPVFEDVDVPGKTITVFDQPSGVWGIQICKDMDFPALSREYGAQGVGLLLVPAWDFTVDGWLHGRMAILRGVENGFTIVRAAKQGILTVSDDRGRVLAEQDAATVRFATLIAAAPVRHDNTLYTRWGDWFAWLNVALLVGIVVSPLSKRR